MESRRAFRRSIGATLADVARLCGVTKQAVSAWELGKLQPPSEMQIAWATALKDLATKAAKVRSEVRL